MSHRTTSILSAIAVSVLALVMAGYVYLVRGGSVAAGLDDSQMIASL
jgi:hypothetical protein